MKKMLKFTAHLALRIMMRKVVAIVVLPMVFAGCSQLGIKAPYFDAGETTNTSMPPDTTHVTSQIYTKVVGQSFNLTVLAAAVMNNNTIDPSISYLFTTYWPKGDSNMDIVDLAAPGCANACTVSGSSVTSTVGDSCQVSGVTIGSPTTHAYGGGTGSSGSSYYYWNGNEHGVKTYTGFVINKAVTKGRVRIYGRACDPTDSSSCTTATLCSNDAFTVRPVSLNITSTPAAGATQAAGVSYTMQAQARDASNAAIAGYTGTPVFTTSNMTDWKVQNISPNFTGNFSAGVYATGISTGTFSYDNFGPLTIPAADFPSTDSTYVANSGSGDVANGDCLTGSTSNTPNGSGLIGCNFPITGVPTSTPTFIPHHYAVTHTITPACNNKFTYFGQPFNFRMTLDALNAAGNRMTRLTAGAKVGGVDITPKPTVTQLNGGSATINPVTIPAANLVWSDDTTYGTSSGGEYFTSTTTTSPYALGTLALSTTRPTGLSTASASPPDYESFVLRTTTSDAYITLCNGVSVASSFTCDSPVTALRYGVLKLTDGIATSLTPANVQITAQYWDTASSSFKTNADDSCTALNFNANTLASTAGVSPAPKSVSATLASGAGTLMLGGSAAGKWAIKLGASDNNCVSATSGGSGTANALSGYLGGVSCSSSYDKDPSAQMQFGTLRSTYIYRSEKF
jgi:hypothetical protein